MKKYIPVNPEPVEAVQWFKHGDHPEVYKNPEDPTTGLIDHDRDAMGYPLQDVTVVNPGDYVLQDYERQWTLSEDDFKKAFKEYTG